MKMSTTDNAAGGFKAGPTSKGMGGMKGKNKLGMGGIAQGQYYIHVPTQKMSTPGLAYKQSLDKELSPGKIQGVFE